MSLIWASFSFSFSISPPLPLLHTTSQWGGNEVNVSTQRLCHCHTHYCLRQNNWKPSLLILLHLSLYYLTAIDYSCLSPIAIFRIFFPFLDFVLFCFVLFHTIPFCSILFYFVPLCSVLFRFVPSCFFWFHLIRFFKEKLTKIWQQSSRESSKFVRIWCIYLEKSWFLSKYQNIIGL